jgi:hypothetical protein
MRPSQIADDAASSAALALSSASNRQSFTRLMTKLVLESNRLPRVLLSTGVSDVTRDAVGHGGFADVFQGKRNGSLVALKRLRLFNDPHLRANVKRVSASSYAARLAALSLVQRFIREALVWRTLNHPNILPFLGIDTATFEDSDMICLVSPWMTHGTASDYVKACTRSTREIVCLVRRRPYS